MTEAPGHIGDSPERREDLELVTGHGEFVDDLKRQGMVFASFVRSEYAHARVLDVDAEAALARDEVLDVYTYEDLAHLPADIPQIYRVPTLEETKRRLSEPERTPAEGHR